MSELLTLATGDSSSYLLLLVIIVALLVVVPKLRRRLHHNAQTAGGGLNEVRRAVREAELQAEISRAADKALVDLLETGREISAQIDTKIRVLNKLVKDADREAARLEKLLGVAREANEPSDLPPPVPSASPVGSGDSARRQSELAERIRSMRDNGLTPEAVAEATGLSLREVNFVLHMLEEAGR